MTLVNIYTTYDLFIIDISHVNWGKIHKKRKKDKKVITNSCIFFKIG
jgi:hypothetical protein